MFIPIIMPAISDAVPPPLILPDAIPSTIDTTLAPEGHHVASLFCQHFAPTLPDGRSWDEARDEAAERVIDTVTAHAPNFRRAIIARKVLTPLDLEREFARRPHPAMGGERPAEH